MYSLVHLLLLVILFSNIVQRYLHDLCHLKLIFDNFYFNKLVVSLTMHILFLKKKILHKVVFKNSSGLQLVVLLYRGWEQRIYDYRYLTRVSYSLILIHFSSYTNFTGTEPFLLCWHVGAWCMEWFYLWWRKTSYCKFTN